jgi:hypothetical protein
MAAWIRASNSNSGCVGWIEPVGLTVTSAVAFTSDCSDVGPWGTRLLSIALAPLAIGISADYYVAVGKIAGYNSPARRVLR